MTRYDSNLLEEVRRDHDHAWATRQEMLLRKLEKMPLASALEYLTIVHLENEFIEDDGSHTRYFPCVDECEDQFARRFWAHVWPLRAKRTAFGRKGKCALDRDDLRRQQRGLQFFCKTTLNGRGYCGFSNPTPFASYHTTIASEVHEPQSWHNLSATDRRLKIRQIVEDLVALADDLKGWVTMYNGMGAGASIDHLHFHAFQLPAGHGPLPIQEAGTVTARSEAKLRFGGNNSYPLSAFRFAGSAETIVQEASSLVLQWSEIDPAATANLIALTEGCETCMYFVPRNKFLEFAPGFPYRVGTMEVAGIFVYSTDNEVVELQQGKINYRNMFQVLRNLCTSQQPWSLLTKL